MHDPHLHLFLDDDEILARSDLPRMQQTLRREGVEPVLAADGREEGTAIGYGAVRREPGSGRYGFWYICHQDGFIRRAESEDGRHWRRRGFAVAPQFLVRCDNLGIAPVGRRVDPFFRDAQFVGFAYLCEKTPGSAAHGLHLFRCRDGERLEVCVPGILPGVGDRSSLMYDQVADEYCLISRPGPGGLAGFRPGESVRARLANLWKSADLVGWTNHGIAVRYDDLDPEDTQIYGMQPFRYGRRLLALVEMYRAARERLDLELAYSDDGQRWRRRDPRQCVFATGGEGAWDSHWVVSTLNEPIPDGDRLRVYYSGAGTKHASGLRHRRGLGLASIRRDGWVSLEAGRTEGRLVTIPLPLERPMRLELNVDCRSGYAAAEVIAAVPGSDHDPLPGCDAGASRVEQLDAVRHRVSWGGRDTVEPIACGRCHLRFTLYQGSLFAYRWSPA